MLNRTQKNFFSLLLAISMLFSMAMTVYAADSTVTYHGFSKGVSSKPGSSFTDTDLFDNFKGVMPGDTLTETITIKNRSHDSDYIKVYIMAETHDEEDNPLSPNVENSGETISSMTDFLSQLYMIVENDGKRIYEASPDELDGFAHPVYLGTILAGQSVSIDVTLQVPIELGNEYARRVGEADWTFLVEAFDYPAPPPPTYEQLTVRKIWNDNGTNRPDSVSVNLLCDGEYERSVVLKEDNQWTYTWDRLDDKYNWSVEEADVPEGYTVSYQTVGSVVTIINTRETINPPPPPPPPPAEKHTALTVKKLWEGECDGHPVSVSVNLLRDGDYSETIVLSNENNWTYTWDKLDDTFSWSAQEVEIPDGYSVEYITDGNTITIINTLIPQEEPKEPVQLTVNKVWSGDEAQIKNRPTSVAVTLYNGTEAIETVWLGEWNNWSYTWRELDGNGDWSVLENIPKGYTPYYSVAGNVVTITNTAILIQTGQLNWPVALFGSVGALMLFIGFIVLRKKKNNDDE